MKLHQFAAIIVLLLSAAWILTGEFSSVGSTEDSQTAAENTIAAQQQKQEETTKRALQAVGVARIPSIKHARTVRISGVTQADKRTDLTARASGIISNIEISKGDIVKKGDVILRLDPEGRDAALKSAEQSLEQAQIDADAKQKLFERQTIAKMQVDRALSALRAAESQVETAKAEIEKLTIMAAFNGVIDDLKVETGGAVQPGAPVATLIALDPIIGIGEVNESDLPIVKVGNDASIRLVNGQIADGKIRFISREAQPNTRTYTVEISVPNPDLNVPAGMTIEVILKGEPVAATPVPRSIVTLGKSGELGVRSINDSDEVMFHNIDILDDSPGALILGGIPENVRIIVQGQNLVSEGQKVQPVEADQETINKLIAETSS